MAELELPPLPDAVDSDVLLLVEFDPEEAERLGVATCYVAGRLREVTDPPCMHRGAPVFFLDEVYQLHRDGHGVVPRTVLLAKRVGLGAEVRLSMQCSVELFGPCPGRFTRAKIDKAWRRWSKPWRHQWLLRKRWAQRRMVGAGVDDETRALWAANYATERLIALREKEVQGGQ